jgi:sulfur-oxidizing protein SoxB
MDMTATTYSYATVSMMSGETIKTVLEDVCDNLFNPDPYYQQGGDMVRVGGLEYSCNPLAAMGKRIDNMRLNGKPLEASRQYKVAGWAPVAEEARNAGNKPVWELVEQWLKARGGVVAQRRINMPQLTGGLPNPGYTAAQA